MGSVMKWVSVEIVLLLIVVVSGPMEALAAQSAVLPNKIIFDNQSGQNTVVKLMGPTKVVSRIAREQRRIVHVAVGNYYVLVRYGNSPKEYSYTKSASFVVDQPENQVSIITFTLHRRGGGGFQSHAVSGDEFESMNTTNMEISSPHSP